MSEVAALNARIAQMAVENKTLFDALEQRAADAERRMKDAEARLAALEKAKKGRRNAPGVAAVQEEGAVEKFLVDFSQIAQGGVNLRFVFNTKVNPEHPISETATFADSKNVV